MIRLILLLCFFKSVLCLDNGLGISSLLGWTTGTRYKCNTDCKNYPDDCISEHLIRMMADMLTLSSFSRAGYNHIIIGDCWMDMTRDKNGRLRADRKRFPKGMGNLSSYLHSKNLKLGLHIDLGNKTCGGFPGSRGHYDLDALTLAQWGVDIVVAEACGFESYSEINTVYPEFGLSLNKTNVAITYKCDWPVALIKKGGGNANLESVSKTCNYFKVFSNEVRSTETLTDILLSYASQSYMYERYTGPGNYLDFNQLTMGGSLLSDKQERFHLALWAIMKSPMLVSCDLTSIRTNTKRLLLNEHLLSIVNDPLGKVAKKHFEERLTSVWSKAIMPLGSWVVAVFNTEIIGLASQTSFKLTEVGVKGASRYNVTEVFTGEHHGVVKPWHYFNCQVDPLGVQLFRFIAI